MRNRERRNGRFLLFSEVNSVTLISSNLKTTFMEVKRMFGRLNLLGIILTAGLTCTTEPVVAEYECPGDFTGDVEVNIDDVFAMLGVWGDCPGCPEDLNGDDVVNIDDVFALLGMWGPCRFEYQPPYADVEAEQIGLEMLGAGGPLLLPQEIYDRIDRDLDLIRVEEPALADQSHSMLWSPTQILVGFVGSEPLGEYDALNTYYQASVSDHGTFSLLTFPGKINVPVMAMEYAALDAISWAEPNGLFGGQNFWTPTDMGGDLWEWHVDDGWHDCYDGCDCHREYTFEVDGSGTVTLTDYFEWGMPWCEFE